jgi:hypothetical protein
MNFAGRLAAFNGISRVLRVSVVKYFTARLGLAGAACL